MATTSAPLDALVYQEGDISKFPQLPHALAVTGLRHADSGLLRGQIPAGSAKEKDFIRQGHGFRPHDLMEHALKLKRTPQKHHATRTLSAFGAESQEAARRLRQEIDHVIRVQDIRARAGASNSAGEGEEIPDGPTPHPRMVSEAEGVRGNMSGAGTFARMLAQRPDAPLMSSPEPAHHFYHGGSKAQKRRAARQAKNRQIIAETQLEQRKEQLVAQNLEVLRAMADEADARRSEEADGSDGMGGYVGNGRYAEGNGRMEDTGDLSPSPSPAPRSAAPVARPSIMSSTRSAMTASLGAKPLSEVLSPAQMAVAGGALVAVVGILVVALRRKRTRR